MVALTYENLGGISGVTVQPKTVPASSRSRDGNDKQRLAFGCDPARPFTGTIHVQATVGDPTASDNIWFDVAEMVINNEGGTWSYEPEGEFASIRVICRDGNYWSAAEGTALASVVTGGNFTIDGHTITVLAGDSVATVVTTINTTAAIITDGTIVADTSNDALRIYKTDGTTLTLTDQVNTPLANMGITSGTYSGGVISSIRMLR